MKLKRTIEDISREFLVTEKNIAGEKCYLVCPDRNNEPSWTQENKNFRSSIWNEEREPVSLSFPKFTNWGENEERFPKPDIFSPHTVVEKRDGSLVAVSFYKGELIVRTRGCFDAYVHDNSYELDVFKSKGLFDHSRFPFGDVKDGTADFTLLYEWESPTNKIILDHCEPRLILIGCVRHDDYSLVSQGDLDACAEDLGIMRPETYSFKNFDELLRGVDAWKDAEGVCAYFECGGIWKVKSDWYKKAMWVKSRIVGRNKMVEKFIELGRPDLDQFLWELKELYDFELEELVRDEAARVCKLNDELKDVLVKAVDFVNNFVLPKETRKEQIEMIHDKYRGKNKKYRGCVVNILDGKPPNNKVIKNHLLGK